MLEGGLVGGAGAVAAQRVDRPPAGDGGEPAAGPGRHAPLGPLGRRRGERLGDHLLGQADVAAHLAGERREERGPLLAVRPLDGLVGGGDVGRVPPTAQASCSWLDRGRTSTDP